MSLKKQIKRALCGICAIGALLSCVTLESTALVDEPVGKMSSTYGYVLNDYLLNYGVIATDEPNGTLYASDGEPIALTGLVYGDIVNFDANENPYLVLYVADGGSYTAQCHIWKYNEEKQTAEKIAVLEKPYGSIEDNRIGEFDLGWNDEKRYIIYKEFVDMELVDAEYYTVIDGDALMYVNNPENVSQTDIMDFNSHYLHPGVNVSNYNQSLNDFFDHLKNSAANSVTYDDMAERLMSEDEAKVEAVLSKAVTFDSFDISNYESLDEYHQALSQETDADNRFYLISNMYNLGDEIYYVRFSTDKSYYNYALLRRSDTAENSYQLLKVSTDCIPLADVELREIREEYSRNTLLYKKTKGALKLEKKPRGENELMQPIISKLPKIMIDKVIDERMRLPAACIGGGIAIALLTILWVFLYGSDD